MNRLTISFILVVVLITFLSMPTFGATTGETELSATPQFVSISNAPSDYNFSEVELNSTANTTINYFVLNNTSSCVINVTITGTSFTGGDDTWTLASDGIPGSNTYALYSGLDDSDDNFDVVVKTSLSTVFMANLSDPQVSWGLKLYTPVTADGYDSQYMSANVTLVGSVA